MSDNQKNIQWGIMGTGWIAEKFAGDLKYADNGELAACGSRTEESAAKFGERFSIPRTYGSYEELVQAPDLDAIYVATPHPVHKDNVLQALRAGKAVLCEKPFTVNSGELSELIDYARAHKLFLMEGMWTRFLPAIVQVRKWVSEGRIGEVLMVKAEFGFKAELDPEHRLFNKELGGGALLDAGIYPVSFASMLLGSDPKNIYSTVHYCETGVDDQFSVLLEYEDGKSASLSGATRLNLTDEAVIYGTHGRIHVPGFLYAHEAVLHEADKDPEHFRHEREFSGYVYEAEEVGRCLAEGRTESSVIPLEESLNIMKLMDTIRGQWGLKYPFEDDSQPQQALAENNQA
ncbi:Gfo/Idh/MocA family protein [Paenibacillus lemnae]|uniref:Gfo/Idh/MocA family oxidoreductase n=1 Tax=Paenibacillus lemnae TaxID=1330551 RepID=A0A848M870_PAELE|nr:Gfo/Idh/MocA family oxidoreductase [Paenibacillus lemnae]NMO97408.1 Gfo/Idh/MocA family oxidoreductase [Paenibacillus lemnae]